MALFQDLHALLRAYNLNSNLSDGFLLVSFGIKYAGFDDNGEHAFPDQRKDLVSPSIEKFTKNNLIVAFFIGSGVNIVCYNGNRLLKTVK